MHSVPLFGATLALLILGAIFYGLLSLVAGLRTDARKLFLAAFLALGATIVLAAFGMADGGPPNWERAFTPVACSWRSPRLWTGICQATKFIDISK